MTLFPLSIFLYCILTNRQQGGFKFDQLKMMKKLILDNIEQNQQANEASQEPEASSRRRYVTISDPETNKQVSRSQLRPMALSFQEQISQQKSHRSQKSREVESKFEPLYSPGHDNNLYSPEQIEIHQKMIENMWDYRYWRHVDNAIRTKDWMPVFAFIGQFKLKCVQLAKMLVNDNFTRKQIDRIDHRYELRGEGEAGIYLIDGIILRVARVKKNKKQFDKRAEKNLHQEYISYNIINDLIISLATEMPDFYTLRVPVTCLVKYQGCTFLCQGDTMCNGIETLIYGPMSSTFKYQQSVSDLLQTIGQNLNLKPFKVSSVNKNIIQIPFCLTVQLHQVNIAFRDMSIINWFNPSSPIYPHHQKQNKLNKPQYYMMSFSKLWPLFIDSDILNSSGYLRPQAVLAWKKELSNAVFSNISFEKDEEGELELAQACKHIKEENIKELASFLDEATFFAVDSPAIEEIMHNYRINIKFLGFVANKFTLASNRAVFEAEMLARTLKKIFFTNAEAMDPQKYKIKDLFVDFLNFIFTHTPESEKFYLEVVFPHINRYYDYQIKQYPPKISGGGLLHAISYHFGYKLKLFDFSFFKKIEMIFTGSHVLESYALARSFNLDTCLLKKSCEKFKHKKKQGNIQQCISELIILANIARLSSPEGTYSVSSAPQSYFYSQLAQIHMNQGKYEQACTYAELALKGIPQKHADSIKASCIMIRYYSRKKENSRMMEYYEKSLTNLNYHLQQNHPIEITVHNTLGYEFLLSSADTSRCEKIFGKSFEICEKALGYMHSNSGKILLQLADLPLAPEKVINFLLQALTILENIETDKKKVNNVCMKISEMYATMGNLTKMIHFARKSGHWKMEITGLEKLNEHKMVLQLCSKPQIINLNLDELSFLIEKSFSSYIKLLDQHSAFNLYKVFISLIDHLPRQSEAGERIMKKLTSEISISITIVQFVKVSLNNLLAEVPELLKEVDFYVGPEFLLEYKDKKIKNLILSYTDILGIVGREKAEKVFIDFRKKF